MKKFLLSNDERKRILEMHYNAMNKPLILEQNEDKTVVEIGTWFIDPVLNDPKKFCTPIMVKGTFRSLNTTDKIQDMSDEFVKALQEEIDKNDILKKSQSANTLNITELSIIGGASNFFNSKSTPYEIENDFYELKDNKITTVTLSDNEKKKYKATEEDIKGNKQLSIDRGQNMFKALQQSAFSKLSITENYKETPKVEGYIVNTGDVIDEVNKKNGSSLNPGQIAKVHMIMCGIEVPDEKIKSCFAGITIDVRYDRENDELNKDENGGSYDHWCNNASYVITGNGIQLKGVNGEFYANLNNQWYHPVFQPIQDRGKTFPEYVNWNLRPYLPNQFPNGKRISEERLQKMKKTRVVMVKMSTDDGNGGGTYVPYTMTVEKFLKKRSEYMSNDPYLGRGGSRNTKFEILEATAEQFINAGNLEKYKGNLVLRAFCVNPGGFTGWGGGCHPGAARIIVKDNEGNVIADEVGKTPMELKSGIELVTVAACSPEKL